MDNRISVIVPVYNLAGLVSGGIASILRQTYTNIEVIAVDDGSADGSLDVLCEIAKTDSRIRVVHQENSGVTAARMTGVRVATGDWIGFVDGDDEIEPDMYERLLRNALQYDADISHCGYQMVFPSRVDYYYNTGRRVIQDRQTGLKDLIEGKFVEPGVWNKLYRRKILDAYLESGEGSFFVQYFEDLLTNFYLFRHANRSVYEDFCPYHYVLRKGSMTSSAITERKLCDPWRVMDKVRNETSNDPVLREAATKRLAGALTGVATMPLGKQAELIRPHRRNARKELRALLPTILHGKYSAMQKIMTAWAALLPGLYGIVHRAYSRITGTDRKYEVR